jgi:hypothetical protein
MSASSFYQRLNALPTGAQVLVCIVLAHVLFLGPFLMMLGVDLALGACSITFEGGVMLGRWLAGA